MQPKVITGSSDGIGRGFAIALAKQGINLILISRSEKKLSKVAEELRMHNEINIFFSK